MSVSLCLSFSLLGIFREWKTSQPRCGTNNNKKYTVSPFKIIYNFKSVPIEYNLYIILYIYEWLVRHSLFYVADLYYSWCICCCRRGCCCWRVRSYLTFSSAQSSLEMFSSCSHRHLAELEAQHSALLGALFPLPFLLVESNPGARLQSGGRDDGDREKRNLHNDNDNGIRSSGRLKWT